MSELYCCHCNACGDTWYQLDDEHSDCAECGEEDDIAGWWPDDPDDMPLASMEGDRSE